MNRHHTRTHQIRSRSGSLAAAAAVMLLASPPALPAGAGAGAEAEDAGIAGLGGESCQGAKLEFAAASAAAAYDETTGRNLRNFPRDRLVDFLHMTLRMRFEDLNDMRFTAVETLRVEPIAAPTASLTLDAIGLDVDAVTTGGEPVEFFLDDETIQLRFDPPLALGREHEIVFEYTCDHPYTGMFFTPADPNAPAYTAEVHTQGQTITNRHWFIAHDSPDERLTTELIVDVPAPYSVSSNGRLVARRDDHDGRTVWHWLQDKPHVSYLVSLVIGEFDVVEIPHDHVPMSVWAPAGMGDRVMRTYRRTGEMIDLFERRFGVPYPWDRYDQLLVKSFGGGMENTSATTLGATAVYDETALLDGNLEGLIAHELAHQWSGDLLTCREWAHIWLNEGFATFGSALWTEERDGPDAYLNAIRRSMRVARRDVSTEPVGMVSPVYERPFETFRRRANPYPKGASILHMLRAMLGEEVFWRGMHVYFQRHALGTVETNDFRYALEEVSGLGLEWFFDQWCFRPGSPKLEVKVVYDGTTRELAVTVEQTQHIDERTPAFRFTLPIHVRTGAGDEVFAVDVREQSTSFRTTLAGAPTVVAIDPELHVLAVVDVDKAATLWERQAASGPTLPARIRAIEALGETEVPDHRTMLAEFIRDESLPEALRNTAVTALTGYGSQEARASVLSILEDGVDEAKVRVNLVGALADFDAESVIGLLAEFARSDPSYATRAAAIGGLGALEATEYADLLVELVNFESHRDRVRSAALRALADLDDPRGLDLAIQYAAWGYPDRSRSGPIRAIGELASHDTDRAVETLLALLDDPHRRPAQAAGSALAKIGDERALKPIQAIARAHPDPRRQEAAKGWAKTLQKKLDEAGDDDDG